MADHYAMIRYRHKSNEFVFKAECNPLTGVYQYGFNCPDDSRYWIAETWGEIKRIIKNIETKSEGVIERVVI